MKKFTLTTMTLLAGIVFLGAGSALADTALEKSLEARISKLQADVESANKKAENTKHSFLKKTYLEEAKGYQDLLTSEQALLEKAKANPDDATEIDRLEKAYKVAQVLKA